MLRVNLLGEFTIEAGGQTLPAPPAAHLLGWLCLHPGGHSRAELARRLWPDLPAAESGAALDVGVGELQRRLRTGASSCIEATAQTVALGGPDVRIDVREFAARIESGDLEAAARIGRGELLPGMDEPWVHEARREHSERVLGVLERLATLAQQHGDLQAAARWTREQAVIDPLSEERHRALIELLAASGDRAGAIAAYERLRSRLRSDLRVTPSAETQALVEKLGR